jgi:TRAP-type C4-dicarboxylate transport system permease small subunit
MDFFVIFAAVLCAGLLLISFVWGAYSYSKHERDGTAGSRASNMPALALLAPLVIAALSVMIALDGVPAWLDAILQ